MLIEEEDVPELIKKALYSIKARIRKLYFW